jgi:TolB-like protein
VISVAGSGAAGGNRRRFLLAGAAAALGAGLTVFLRTRGPANALAVVPARWTFADPSGLHEADAMLAEAVTAKVAKRGRIPVIGWSSIVPFRKNPQLSPAIAKATGAAMVLAISVRATGGQYRVTTFLVEPFTGRKRWAEDFYAQELASFDTLAETIAQDLELALGAAH